VAEAGQAALGWMYLTVEGIVIESAPANQTRPPAEFGRERATALTAG
jgi:hypothetical protein